MNEISQSYKKLKDYIKRVEANANKFADELKREAEKEFKVVKEEILREYGEKQQQKVREIFQRVVGDFYDDYEPNLYHRQYGLKKEGLLSLQLDNYGRVTNNTFESFFNEEAMHSDRRGNTIWRNNGVFTSLFDLTFMHGWHGGSTTSDEEEHHPSPGTPYYRKPHPYYSEWGDVAYQSNPSPFENFKMLLEDVNKPGGEISQELKRIKKEHFDKFGKKVGDEIVPRLTLKYFGKL